MLLCTLWVLFHLLDFYTVSGASCGCSSLVIPVHVDVLVPKDPTDKFAGLKSNASSLRRIDDTYDIFGVFCRPDAVSLAGASVVQLLVHGFTYTNQYWSPPVEEFRNYSYAAFSCERGLPSLAVDWLGVGLSTRPKNSSDVQYPTAAAAVSQVALHLKTASIVPGVLPFKKVIGIGHSAGSGLLNFNAIVDGPQSIFDGLILTGSLSVPPDTVPSLSILTPAQDDTPLRWGTLDPGYVTTSNRSIFYPADTTAFSPRMMEFDNFTKDVGTVATFEQTPITSLTAQYTGPVVKIVGSEDQLFCAADRCVNITELTALERVGWPAAQSFEVVVEQGNGHDMNLDFAAQGPFNTFVNFVDQFSNL
ncbi:Alpha/beta hydrolase family-domain-containing protein [Mycena sanguinolenta]|uniref:Alpha/beta hydrolase family-domain-containing protein n=1 Tax=Mycena sanguinolenta TaxID=230812 RepID=A0A8H6ZI47_9AGAR|nr:Alpha/beta hydrolase family-domain-containing protein [Mycena sanguinolenta]